MRVIAPKVGLCISNATKAAILERNLDLPEQQVAILMMIARDAPLVENARSPELLDHRGGCRQRLCILKGSVAMFGSQLLAGVLRFSVPPAENPYKPGGCYAEARLVG